MPFASQVRALDDLRGPAGALEALLNSGAANAPYSALIAHPHPLFGGTLHNKVVYNAMKVFSSCGLPVLRFNFRGAGRSEGVHDLGQGEISDVRAALHYLAEILPETAGKPVLFAGFSFGSHVGLRACCGDPRVRGLVALGLPVQAAGRLYTYEFLPHCTQPKLFVSGDHDAFCPPAALLSCLAAAPQPSQHVLIEGADHFFQGIPASSSAKLEAMQTALRDWLKEHFQLVPLA